MISGIFFRSVFGGNIRETKMKFLKSNGNRLVVMSTLRASNLYSILLFTMRFQFVVFYFFLSLASILPNALAIATYSTLVHINKKSFRFVAAKNLVGPLVEHSFRWPHTKSIFRFLCKSIDFSVFVHLCVPSSYRVLPSYAIYFYKMIEIEITFLFYSHFVFQFYYTNFISVLPFAISSCNGVMRSAYAVVTVPSSSRFDVFTLVSNMLPFLCHSQKSKEKRTEVLSLPKRKPRKNKTKQASCTCYAISTTVSVFFFTFVVFDLFAHSRLSWVNYRKTWMNETRSENKIK